MCQNLKLIVINLMIFIKFINTASQSIDPGVYDIDVFLNKATSFNIAVIFDEFILTSSGRHERSEIFSIDSALLGEENTSLSKLINLTEIQFETKRVNNLKSQLHLLKNLKTLKINNATDITSIEDLFYFANLKSLAITDSNIKSLPCSISRLEKLEELDLRRNNLSILPPTIGRMKRLSKLYISGNNILSLTRSIANCKKLRVLKVDWEKLLPFGFGDTIGAIELKYILQQRKIPLPDRSETYFEKAILSRRFMRKNSVYKSIRSSGLHFKYDNFENAKLIEFNGLCLENSEILDKIIEVCSRSGGDDFDFLIEYIEVHFSNELGLNTSIFRMYDQYMPETRIILRNIVTELSEIGDIENLKHFLYLFKKVPHMIPALQICFLYNLYIYILKVGNVGVDEFVVNSFAILKDYIFTLAASPSTRSDNDLAHWKSLLSKELGLGFIANQKMVYEPYSNPESNCSFKGSESLLLYAFSQKFTVDYVALNISLVINSAFTPLLTNFLKYFAKRFGNESPVLKELFQFQKKGSKMVPISIDMVGIEYILKEVNLLN